MRGTAIALLALLFSCGGGEPDPAPVAAPGGGGGGSVPGPGVALSGPPGARSFKSGPVQITADGSTVWTANIDNDSVSRIDTATFAVVEIPIGGAPRSVSVTEDGSEVWVACEESDEVKVLRGSDGAVLATVPFPWGSAPYGIALSPDQQTALVTLHRRGTIAEIDVSARTVRRTLEPVWRTPAGIAWEGTTAFVSHLLADGEHSRLTRIDCAGPTARVAGEITVFATDPRASARLAAPFDIAEGGYLSLRGHLGKFPGREELWLPVQYNNIHDDRFSPDSTVQATIRKLQLDDLSLPNGNDDKVILSAVHVHDPAQGNAYSGPGWNATVSGPVDIAFAADGSQAYVVCELSNEVVVVGSATSNVRPSGAPALPEIRVGDRPAGIAVSPIDGAAYVLNRFSRDLSVIETGTAREVRRVALNPVTGEPETAAFLRGAKLFHTSADPRISNNEKVACASCHFDAEIDGRRWNFHALSGRSGSRATLTLRGLSLTFGPRDPTTGFGQLHRSGDRDEVQDFEHTFTGETMGGTGFLGAKAQPSLGVPNAGRDADLDAIATYLLGLAPIARSPHRASDGSLTESARRGARLFFAARCDQCHVPETGFVDFAFHDVGSRRPGDEEELNHNSRGEFMWHVNTKTLVGLFATPGYQGVATFADTIDAFLADIAQRTSHGDIRDLNEGERADLGHFLLSVDGNTTAAEVRSARDETPPTLTRVAITSLTRVDVWFHEPVGRATAEDAGSWRIVRSDGTAMPVTAAQWGAKNGDRVTLTVALQPNTTYDVTPPPVTDGAGNALVPASNRKALAVGDTATITLGSSGYQNLTIAVHDAGVVGPNLATWNHDSPQLFIDNNGRPIKGFVRFEWRNAFAAATGVGNAGDIVAAEFSLHASRGHTHPIEARRCLQPWTDASGGNWNRKANGAPTWRDHSHSNARWNQAGARRRAAGVEGRDESDFNGPNDLAFTPDAVADPQSLTEPVVFEGPSVRDAFRFWLDHPDVDYGYVLELAPNPPKTGYSFHRHESAGGRFGPVLTITYRLR